MKSNPNTSVKGSKKAAIWALFSGSALIMLMGLGFCVYSMLNNVQLPVMSTNIPGAAFGAIVAFLGARYFLEVRKLRARVYRAGAEFSWSNFKR